MTIVEGHSEACIDCGNNRFWRPMNDKQHMETCVSCRYNRSDIHKQDIYQEYYYNAKIYSRKCRCGYSTEEHLFTEVRFERGKHWYVCEICEEIDRTSITDHTLEIESKSYEGHANVCTICDYEEELEYHEYEYIPRTDKKQHWSECSACHRVEDKGEHTDTIVKDGKCDGCQLEMDHTHEYNWVNNGDGTHTGTCYCTETPEDPDCNWKPERPTFNWFFAWTKVMEQINKRIICLFSWVINL